MIEIRKLSKTYPGNKESTLKDITLDFQDVGLYYLIGSSGSGKSTLLYLIGGMDYEYEGSLKVNGKELKEMKEKERADYLFSNIAFAFQDNRSNEKDTVENTIWKSLEIEKLSKKEKEERLTTYLEKLDLKDKRKEKLYTLSGGERKRVAIIRALVKKAPILLLDEPLSSLNPELRKKLTELFIEESNRRLVIIITHETENIQDTDNLFYLTNGTIETRQIKEAKENDVTFKKKERIPYDGIDFLKDILRGISQKSEFLFITLFSLAIALFSVSFSFLLSTGVKNSLSDTLSSYMKSNSMVITSKEERFEEENYQTGDYHFLSLLKRDYPKEVIAISPFYLENIDDIFQSEQRMTLSSSNRTITLNKLSMNSFLEYRIPEELKEEEKIYGKKENLTYDEVILALDYDSIASFYYLLFNKTIPALTDDILEEIINRADTLNIGLRIQCQKNDWNYRLDHMLTIVGIIFSKNTFIVHTEDDFNEHFLKDTMHFKDYLEEEEEEEERTPIEIPKCLGIRIHPLRKSIFLKHFLFDRNANHYTLKPLTFQSYYRKEDKYTHNRFAVYRDYLSKVNPSEILTFAKDNHNLIEGLCYSTPVFTFTASGYISGFTKPFFFSKYKEKLNQIEDNYLHTEENLGQFQGSLLKVEEGVIKADLLSSSEENGLKYHSLDQSMKRPILGKAPEDYHGIGISKDMAISLYGSMELALESKIQVLMLSKTVKAVEGYDNLFDEGSLTITGIYEDKGNSIYQDSLFPLCFAFENSQLEMDDIRILEAVVDVDLEKTTTDYFEKEIRRYGDYQVSFPMLSMQEEIESTMERLSDLFLAFAVLSLLLSTSLLSLSLYLIIERDKKEIGILLSLGFNKEEVTRYYLCFSLTIGLFGYLISLSITLLAEKILKSTLVELLSNYRFTLTPYFISLIVCLSVSFLIGTILGLKIRSYSPKNAFMR